VVDTPFLNDGADESLRKTVSLLNKIEAKTGATTITGPVTVSNEVEVTNSSGSPIPVSGTVTANTGLTQPLTNTELRLTAVPVSLASVPSHAVTGPLTDTQLRAAVVPVSLASVPSHPVTGTFFQATQPVSIASAPVTPVTDNGGSLTVDGTVTVNDMTSGNAKTKIVDSVGADVSYITAGTAGTPSASVLSVQGISGGVSLPISGTVNTGLTQPLTDTQLRAAVVPVSLASVPSHAVTQTTAANLNATVVGSGSFTAAQSTASSLKAQAQILNSAGSLVTYAETGTYGSPSVDVLSVQNPQGVTATITPFTSTTASTSLVAVGSTRKALTVYNSGPGDLYISPTAVCSTTNFQLKLSSGDFWECPASQVLLSHTGVFATSGTAYITSLI
jgi:hypothetical protein